MAQDPSPQTAERDIESPQSPRAPTTAENRSPLNRSAIEELLLDF